MTVKRLDTKEFIVYSATEMELTEEEEGKKRGKGRFY